MLRKSLFGCSKESLTIFKNDTASFPSIILWSYDKAKYITGLASIFPSTTIGLSTIFFSYFFVNIAAVTGMAPVTGVPHPLISYGGSAMLVVLGSFGLIQSAHVHRLIKRE